MSEFLATYGDTILAAVLAVLTAVGSYFGNKIKNYLDSKERARVIKEAVESAVGQAARIEPKLTGHEKYEWAAEKVSEYLGTKGITISELELEIAIEKAVNAVSKNVAKTLDELTYVALTDEEVVTELEASGKGDEEINE